MVARIIDECIVRGIRIRIVTVSSRGGIHYRLESRLLPIRGDAPSHDATGAAVHLGDDINAVFFAPRKV